MSEVTPSIIFGIPENIAGENQRQFTLEWREQRKLWQLIQILRAGLGDALKDTKDCVFLRTNVSSATPPEKIEVAIALAGANMRTPDEMTYGQQMFRTSAVMSEILRAGSGRMLSKREGEMILRPFIPIPDFTNVLEQLGASMRAGQDVPVFCTSIRNAGESLVRFYMDYVQTAIKMIIAPRLPSYWHEDELRTLTTMMDDAYMMPVFEEDCDDPEKARPTEMGIRWNSHRGIVLAANIFEQKDALETSTGLTVLHVENLFQLDPETE